MHIEIITIGNEVLSGRTLNTNVKVISHELKNLGYSVSKQMTISDDIDVIKQEVSDSLEKSDIVITTGGLGPTFDDVTIKAFQGSPLELPNKYGTAPGLWYQNDSLCIALPGVPEQMEQILKDEVLPRISKLFPITNKKFYHHFFLCLVKEIDVDEILRGLVNRYSEVEFGVYPSTSVVRISLCAEKNDLLEPIEEIRNYFKDNIFSEKDDRLALALHELMIEKKKTLCLAESCTGGKFAAALTAIPDASLYFLGSAVTYSNLAKENILDVKSTTIEKYGAVSSQTAEEMARNARKKMDADYAISITGIAGPGGGSPQKPIGTIWVCLTNRSHDIMCELVPVNLSFNREMMTSVAVNWCIAKLINFLK